jgi:hypothetical protein
MNVNAGFGFSDGMVGVGVASGVGIGAGTDFCTRRPDCATTANAHKNSNVAHKLALRALETEKRLGMSVLASSKIVRIVAPLLSNLRTGLLN